MRRIALFTTISIVVLLLAQNESGWTQDQVVITSPTDPVKDDEAKLRQQKDDLWEQMAELGEGKTPSESILILEYRTQDMVHQRERLSILLEEAAESKAELERLREEVKRADGETVAGTIARQGISEIISRLLGKIGGPPGRAASTAVQIAKWVIQKSSISGIDDLLQSERITIEELVALETTLSKDIATERSKLQVLKETLDEYREVSERLHYVRATSHAVTRRETDAVGDREEARRAILVTPSGPPPPPRRTGVSVSKPKPAKPKPKAQSSKKASPSQARQHESGTSAAVIQLGVGLGLQLLNRGSRSGSQQNQGSNWNR